MENGNRPKLSRLALKWGIAGAIGFGAVATGMFVSRRGRHLMREAFEGRRRTRLEDRVLDRLWGHPVLGRREVDVEELGDGVLALTGLLRGEEERHLAISIAEAVQGVKGVEDHLDIAPPPSGRRGR